MSEISSVTSKRPHFGPRQIRSLRGLWPGKKVVDVDVSESKQCILTWWPFQENGIWQIRLKCYSGMLKEWFEETVSLRDHNIFPYDNGLWNKHVHFKR